MLWNWGDGEGEGEGKDENGEWKAERKIVRREGKGAGEGTNEIRMEERTFFRLFSVWREGVGLLRRKRAGRCREVER